MKNQIKEVQAQIDKAQWIREPKPTVPVKHITMHELVYGTKKESK